MRLCGDRRSRCLSYPLGLTKVQRGVVDRPSIAEDHPVDELLERHRRACAEFARVAHAVPPDAWSAPTPCTEWDARALVEHVIGFHDFLLLRPLGVRANRPRTDPRARWEATRIAIFVALERPGAIDEATDLPGGGQSTPRAMLGALTTEV